MYVPDMPATPERTASSIARDVIVWALGLVSFGLSGWSLTTLLMSVGTPFVFALLGVGVFDLLALLAALQVYERRHEPHKGAGARLVMMLALLASSVVNANHGYAMGGWPTAVVFGAAPLVFEIGFEIRHRSLTGLIWVLFFREAREALKRDAWVRIAPVTAPPSGPGDLPVSIGLERADQHALTPQEELARPQGKELAPVAPELALAPTGTVGQAEGTGYPQANGVAMPEPAPLLPSFSDADEPLGKPAPVLSADLGKDDAPGLARQMGKEVTAPGKPVGKLLGKGRPVSIAAAVREAASQGLLTADEIAAKVPEILGTQPKPSSVRREINRQWPTIQARQAEKTNGIGQYL